MSEIDTSYGFPYIPYSRLKELKYHAEMVVIAAGQGSFSGSDLWRIYVGLEVNSLMAEHWYSELERARNYNPVAAAGCPLCVYDNGKFIARCGYHKLIDYLLSTSELPSNDKENEEAGNGGRSGTHSEGEGSSQ